MGLEEKTELHLYPAENCTLTVLPGVAKVVHSKACCTVHWQETGRCRQNIKDIHLLPPAQILARTPATKDMTVPVSQGTQGTMKGQVKQIRSTTDGRTGFKTTTSMAGEGSQCTEEEMPSLECTSAGETISQQESPKTDEIFDGGQQELGENGEHAFNSPKSNSDASTEECSGNEVPLMESPEPTTTTELCVCGGMVNNDETLLLDPHDMKSCPNSVDAERCACLEKSSEKGVTALDINGFLGDPSAVHSGMVKVESSSQQLADSSPQLSTDTASMSSNSTAVDDCDNRTLSSNCTHEQPVVCTDEVSDNDCLRQTVNMSLPSQGQAGSASILPKPPKEDATHLVQQVLEDGWSPSTSENLTLAELYLMLGKPSKLQLEYDWVQTQRNNAEETERSKGTSQRLLKCLLQIITTEVNPKSVSTFSMWGRVKGLASTKTILVIPSRKKKSAIAQMHKADRIKHWGA